MSNSFYYLYSSKAANEAAGTIKVLPRGTETVDGTKMNLLNQHDSITSTLDELRAETFPSVPPCCLCSSDLEEVHVSSELCH